MIATGPYPPNGYMLQEHIQKLMQAYEPRTTHLMETVRALHHGDNLAAAEAIDRMTPTDRAYAQVLARRLMHILDSLA